MFETGVCVDGFRVTRNEACRELNGRMIQMIHVKTGARLFWLDNGAENKVFSITFKTLPTDDTGVFHILEHSVLCGSGKYPVREPFVELLKSSMSTYLNAMTFPDMTMYPVSSRNDRDILNLTEVYLDAVFDPVCIREEKVFRQEGWHIEWDEDGKPVYKGVVFNEMKGAMSETDELIDDQIRRQLFPDTSYGFNSGGAPEHIPALSYETFKEQYRKHYHPSNAYIYLDGAVPILEMLGLISDKLKDYEKREDLPAFKEQTPVGSERTIFYELGQDESAENRGHLTLSRLTGNWTDRTENMARTILCDVMTGSNEAPLKRLALERGLCENLTISVDDTGYQSLLTIHAENVKDGRENEIIDLLKEYGESVRREGMDAGAIEASMNRLVFHMKEEEEPQGIGRCIRAMGTWLYGGDPAEALKTDAVIQQLREMLQQGAFKPLAEDMLLNLSHMAVLHTRPSHTVGEEKRAAEAARLAEITGGWNKKDTEENRTMLKLLEEWQTTPDSPEALGTLPTLSLREADVEPAWTETEERTCLGTRVLFHRLACNGIVHLKLYFRLTDLTLEELTKASGLSGLLGKLPTHRHDALSLQQEIKRATGAFGFSMVTRAVKGEEDTCVPYLTAYVSALKENVEKAQALMTEVLTETVFTDQDKITEMIRQMELGTRQRVLGSGHAIGIKEALSRYSAEGAAINAMDGVPAVRYIHRLAKDTEKELPAFLETLQKVLREDICRKRMLVSITADEALDSENWISSFPEGRKAPEKAIYRNDGAPALGYRIPAQIGFAVQGYRLNRCGRQFNGSMWLVANMLSLDFLWNRVRVRGGSYGAGISVSRSGNIFAYSYRDPSPDQTLKVFRELPEFIASFGTNGIKLDNYIISSLNELNPLMSARDRGSTADMRVMTGYTREEAEKIRREVLNTTPADLAECKNWLQPFAEEGTVCVVAHQDALAVCDGLEIADL